MLPLAEPSARKVLGTCADCGDAVCEGEDVRDTPDGPVHLGTCWEQWRDENLPVMTAEQYFGIE